MKRLVKVLLGICFLLAESFSCFCQELELRGGATIMPGIYTSLRYEHYTNSELNVAGGLFMESSNKNNLRYRSYGLDLLTQYSSDRDNENSFSFKVSTGVVLQIENEPWIYKDWKLAQRLNYGLIAEGAGFLRLSDAFSISLFAQQKFLFNKILATTHFLFGMGLSYRLSQ
jgi:hypothetical protein